MSEQPKALALADTLEKMPLGAVDAEAAAELRRLHALNAQMLEALNQLLEAADSMRGTYGVQWGDTPEDMDTFTHDKWAEDFLQERAEEARAALAAFKEKA